MCLPVVASTISLLTFPVWSEPNLLRMLFVVLPIFIGPPDSAWMK